MRLGVYVLSLSIFLICITFLFSGTVFAAVESIATGFTFTEGPVWHPDGYLLFSDQAGGNTIHKWIASSETVEVFRFPSNDSNGLTYDCDGLLIICEQENRRVVRLESDGTTVTELAHLYNGDQLNSPNDVVVKSDGSIYFTDPDWGGNPPELGFLGVFRISPGGTLTLLLSGYNKPNGLAFSPDESILYVCEDQTRKVYAFDVQPDGTLDNKRTFITLGSGGPDGMKVDTQGNLYVTNWGGGVWVYNKTGQYLETITVPENPSNVAFGGADYKTLFITAGSSVYRTYVSTPGIPGMKECPSTPSLSVNTENLDFGEVEPGEDDTKSFEISNAGSGTLSGTITDDQAWITVSPTSFNNNSQTVSVTVNNSKQLTDGQYSGTVTVKAGSAGTKTITVKMTATCVFVRPNPYNPRRGELTFFGSGVANGTIKIYTLAGELVKTLKEPEGKETIEWDGKNEAGEEVISGIYLYTTENSYEKNACSFTVIKR